MTAAMIWIVFPGLIGAILGAARLSARWSAAVGLGTAGALAILGLFAPVDEAFSVGPIELLIRSEQVVLGRSLAIGGGLVRVVGAAYGALALWVGGALAIGANRFFLPSGLLATAALSAAVAVQPWQFAGVFILLAVLVLVPLLAPPGPAKTSGVLKFVSFQAIGIPFLIIAGTLMEGRESIPAGLSLTLRPGIFLGFSFIFLFAVFPFHGWILGLVEEVEPMPFGFTLVLLSGFTGVLGLQIIDRYAFLRNAPEFFTLVRTVGTLSVVAGAVLVVVQQNAGRILGYTALIETGLLMLAVGAGPGVGPGLFFPIMAARSAGFGVWTGGLGLLKRRGVPFDLRRMGGAFAGHRLACTAVMIGSLSTAGLPLLTGYPAKLRLAAFLGAVDPTAVIAIWLGVTAASVAGLRVFAAMTAPGADLPSEIPHLEETPLPAGEPPRRELFNLSAGAISRVLLASGCLILVILGLAPGWVAWLVETIPPAFGHLVR